MFTKAFRFFILLSLCIVIFNDTGFAQPGKRKKANPVFNPDTVYYPFYNQVQMIEINYKRAWVEEAYHKEGYQPRAMPFGFSMPRVHPGVYIFRNQSGTIIRAYNSGYSLDSLNKIFKDAKKEPSQIITGKSSYPVRHSFPIRVMEYAQQLEKAIPGFYKVYTETPQLFTYTPEFDEQFKVGLIDTLGTIVFPIEFDYIESIGNDFLVKKSNLFGVLNKEKQAIIPVAYESVSQTADAVIFSNNNKKEKIYDFKKKTVTTLNNYDWIDEDRFDDADQISTNGKKVNLIAVRKNGLTGFINQQKKEIVTPVYDYAQVNYQEGRSLVCRNNKWGYVDENGKEIIPCQYEDAMNFYQGKALVTSNGSVLCIDINGNVTAGCDEKLIKWEKSSELGDRGSFIKNRYIAGRVHRYGIVDESGKFKAAIYYENITGIRLSNNKTEWSQQYYKARRFSKWGVISKNGDVILPFEYDDIYDFNGGHNKAMLRKDERYGMVNEDFKMLLPCKYEALNYSSIPGKIIFTEKGKQGWMDANLKVQVIPQYNEIGNVANARVRVKKDNFYGIIDTSGKEIVPIRYESLATQFFNGLILASWRKKWGYVDSTGTVAIAFQYDNGRNFSGKITAVQKGKLYGFINRNNEPVSGFMYDFVDYEWTIDGLIKVVKKEKIGFVNQEGREVIPCMYDEERGFNPKLGHYLRLGTVWMYVN
ncbi:MAG: WG repeat-containing protein [Prolixibacteraceae bacterium]|nr:WG repeat-containing protein [Prolixibacteraceae bacterium]